ncbi:MAG: PfkB family carbohydrate kinase [Acidimicrobiales bacterium]
MSPSYLTVGSVCWDAVPGSADPRLGGSALFASRVALRLGWEVVVVTSGTPELADAARRALPGVEVMVQPSSIDTAFGFDDRADLGPHRLLGRGAPIDLGAPGVAAAIDRADVVHLAPVMGELAAGTFAHARRAGFVGVTPQGLLRTASADGVLQAGGRYETSWADLVDAVVLSEPELERVADRQSLRQARTAVTRGERGATGFWGDEEVAVDGIAVGDVGPLGTIGAGDTFAAAFFTELATGSAFADALRHANQVAAAHVAELARPS